MPTYLLHGFKWHRAAIRIHIVLSNLDDAAPEWIVAPASAISLLNSFYTAFDFLPPSSPPAVSRLISMEQPSQFPPPPPEPPQTPNQKTLTKKKKSMISMRSKKERPTDMESAEPVKQTNGHHAKASNGRHTPSASMASNPARRAAEKLPTFNDWSVVKLVEQHDPEDLTSQAVSQPWAYVADHLIQVKLGVNIGEEMAKYEAKVRGEEEALGMPLTPATPVTPGTAGSSGGEASNPQLSARDRKRKSRRLNWFEKLRDQLQKGEDIGWYVVVCGDEERLPPAMELDEEDWSEEEGQKTPKTGSLRGFFHKRRISRDE